MKALRLLWISLCLLVPLAAQAQSYDAQLREFETFVEAKMKEEQIPGLSIAVMKGDFVWSKGFGLADLENRVPASAESSYRLASVTKPMTAVAALKLAEEGKLDLDAEVQRYVPSFPRKQWPVTVRQLLGHLGGISHYRDVAAEGHFREPKNTAQAVAVFRDFDLVSEPGTRFNYSTYGYVLLGAVIEAAAGKPYGEVLREKVWAPLGMNATRMDDMRAIIPNRVRGYELAGGKLRLAEYVDVSSRFAGGGTRSTVIDMISFVRALAAGKVLRAETLDLMWTTQVTRDARPTGYGLGWDVNPVAGRFRVFHDGSQPETETYLLLLPRARFAIAMATNLEDADLNAFAARLAKIFLGDDWTAGQRIRGDERQINAGAAVLRAYNNGLAYFDRYGKPMTAQPDELKDAFAALNATIDGGRITREQMIRAGSHVAQWHAARNDVERQHHDGAFAFFATYDGSPKLTPKLKQQIATWRTDWARTSAIRSAAGLLAAEDALANASVIPDFIGELVNRAQQAAIRGDIPRALATARTAAVLYPDSDATNGLLGVLLIVSGDTTGGEQAVRRSAALNRSGFFGPANVMRIAGFLANGATRPAAIKILSIAKQIHPDDPAIAAMLAKLP